MDRDGSVQTMNKGLIENDRRIQKNVLEMVIAELRSEV